MLALLSVGVLALSAPVSQVTQDGGAQDGGTLERPRAAAERLDELWKTRDEPAASAESRRLVAEILAAPTSDYDALWRASRVVWWESDGLSGTGQKKQLGLEARALAERALKARPGGFEARYYLALAVGAYAQGVGILTALTQGLDGAFTENLDAVLKKNAAYDRAGPLRAKGRYYWELPWPRRDLKKSKSILEEAIRAHPEAMRSYLYLAETLLKDGQPQEARAALERLRALDDAFDPPEARRVRAWARDVGAAVDAALK